MESVAAACIVWVDVEVDRIGRERGSPDGDVQQTGSSTFVSPTERAVLLLFDLFTRHDVVATWAAADPATSPTTGILKRIAAWHEIALLASPEWMAWHGEPNQAMVELDRRRLAAWRAGCPVTSLVFTDLDPVEAPWLGQTQGWAVTAGRPIDLCRSDAPPRDDGSNRFGAGPVVAPTAFWLGSKPSWSKAGDTTACQFELLQRAKQQRSSVVAIRLSDVQPETVAGIAEFFETAARLERSCGLNWIGLSDLGRVSIPRRLCPMRSALRPAA